MTKKPHVDFKVRSKLLRKYYNDTRNAEVNSEVYNYIIDKFNNLLIEELLKGNTVSLGSRLGHLYIKKYKILDTNPFIDWKLTKQKGYHVYNLYENTGYKVTWAKSKCKVANKTAYLFQAARSLNRKIWYKHLEDPTFREKFN